MNRVLISPCRTGDNDSQILAEILKNSIQSFFIGLIRLISNHIYIFINRLITNITPLHYHHPYCHIYIYIYILAHLHTHTHTHTHPLTHPPKHEIHQMRGHRRWGSRENIPPHLIHHKHLPHRLRPHRIRQLHNHHISGPTEQQQHHHHHTDKQKPVQVEPMGHGRPGGVRQAETTVVPAN